MTNQDKNQKSAMNNTSKTSQPKTADASRVGVQKDNFGNRQQGVDPNQKNEKQQTNTNQRTDNLRK